jgi:hypothetical protein
MSFTFPAAAVAFAAAMSLNLGASRSTQAPTPVVPPITDAMLKAY